ncbi:MAG: DPP IV N-terminal domain-containing protein, partial [Acidobacteriota bacterium]|nr:DPP IV N-terminal domain-containing protein [Acidobacteriota bacterium]
MKRLLSSVALLLSLSLLAQDAPRLDVDTIMRGPGLTGYAPRNVRWSRDGQLVYFQWKQYSDPTEEQFDTYVAGRDGKGLRKLSDEEAKDAPPVNGRWTRDRKRAVYVDNGDVFLYDSAARKRRAITKTTEAESNARFTREENRVTFVRGNNLFVVSLQDGTIEQKTNIVGANDKGPNVTLFDDENKDRTASQKWVAEEAKKLSEVLGRRAAEKKEEDEKRKKELAIAPLKLKSGESVSDLELTPDGRYVIAFIGVEADKAKRPVVPSYVTATGYTTDLPARTKVGDVQEASRVASISTVDGKVQWLKHGLKPATPQNDENAQKTGAKTQSVTQNATEATAEKTETKEPQERDVELAGLFWSDDGAHAVLPVRANDNKDWWLLAFDPATAATRVLFHEHDPAWVQWLEDNKAGFIPNTSTVWLISEQSGWLQLYSVPYAGGEPRALTTGKYEIDDVAFSDDKKNFYLTTSMESPFERHLYRMPVSGGAMTKLTASAGFHNAVMSPDGTTLADVYSYTNKPPELYV